MSQDKLHEKAEELYALENDTSIGKMTKEYKIALIVSTLHSVAERDVEIAEATATEVYPEDIFIPPPPGQHGRTVDSCSAAGARVGAGAAARRIRREWGLDEVKP